MTNFQGMYFVGVNGFPGIVFVEAALQIGSQANIKPIWVSFALQHINIMHVARLHFVTARHPLLLRYGVIGQANHAVAKADGGWGGIRTLETLARLPVFKTGAFNHSATHPVS